MSAPNIESERGEVPARCASLGMSCLRNASNTAAWRRDDRGVTAAGNVLRRAGPNSEARCRLAVCTLTPSASPSVSDDLTMFVTQHSGVWDRDAARPVVGVVRDRLRADGRGRRHDASCSPASSSTRCFATRHSGSGCSGMARNPWPCALSRPISRGAGYLSTPTSRPATRRTPQRHGALHLLARGPPRHAAKGAIIRLAKECLALEAHEGALLVFDTPETNERSTGGGFTRMMERLAKMVGAPAPVQLLEVQRYYAIDLSTARAGDASPSDSLATASTTLAGSESRRAAGDPFDPAGGRVQRVVAPRS